MKDFFIELMEYIGWGWFIFAIVGGLLSFGAFCAFLWDEGVGPFIAGIIVFVVICFIGFLRQIRNR